MSVEHRMIRPTDELAVTMTVAHAQRRLTDAVNTQSLIAAKLSENECKHLRCVGDPCPSPVWPHRVPCGCYGAESDTPDLLAAIGRRAA